MKHKWSKGKLPNKCEACGLIRTRKTFKYLMAISNVKPYNHYKYETKVVYKNGDMTIYKAPVCLGINIFTKAVVSKNVYTDIL